MRGGKRGGVRAGARGSHGLAPVHVDTTGVSPSYHELSPRESHGGHRVIRCAILTLGLGLSPVPVLAFDLNDCIINGMKGVSSDIAARQVRYACDQKSKEYKQQRLELLAREFGEVVDVDTVEGGKFYEVEAPGFYSMLYTNKSAEMTVTFLRVEVVPAPGGPGTNCDMTKRRVFAYKVSIKPGASTKLIYPSAHPSNCVTPLVVLARVPSWKDISFSSSARPSEKDPFAGLD